MKRRTTTLQINEAITNNLLQVIKAECYHKSTRQTDVIEPESFIENFQFLCESGCFVDCVGWYFEKDYKKNQYIIECCRLDGGAENIVTVYLHPEENVNVETINNILIMKEED